VILIPHDRPECSEVVADPHLSGLGRKQAARVAPSVFFEADYKSINRFVCARRGQRSVVSLNGRVLLR
jgi:hypothetical protein